MSNNVQILNFNHSVVEVAGDNKLIITDNTKNNSITIPQPVTNILQVNSPGPQGPAGGGSGSINTSSFATTGSNTFRGNQISSGSIIFNSGAQVTPTFFGYSYLGAIDIIAGPGGYAELASNNTQSYIWVDNNGAYVLTAEQHQFEFRDDGYFVIPQVQSLTKQAGILSAGDIIIQADETQSWRFSSGSGILTSPGGIEAPSFTGSLEGTSSWTNNYNETDPVFTAVSGTFATTGSNSLTGSQIISGSLTITGSLLISSGSNTKVGTATLVSGNALVSNTSVTSTSLIFLTSQSGGTSGALRIAAKTPGTSFAVSSSNGADISTFAYLIIN